MSLTSRIRLAAQRNPENVVPPSKGKLFRELHYLGEPVRRIRRTIPVAPATEPKVVMFLPGFMAHPMTMRFLAKQLERAGHTVNRWGQGFNLGPSKQRFDIAEKRLTTLFERHPDKKIYLVGWSLGGLYARELALRHPNHVAKVITMGSPFSGSKRANNAWRLYQLVTDHSVDEPPVVKDTSIKPPVPTVALWSKRDGVIAPECASGKEHERDKAVHVDCTHIGFSYDPNAVQAVLAELELGEAIDT